MVGPPETGLVTGYRRDGDVMLGWSFFQESPEFADKIMFDESGYYVSECWWENGVGALIAMGDRSGDRITPEQVVAMAIEILSPRTYMGFAKGLAAYDAWLASMSDDVQFTNAAERCADLRPEQILAWRLMCQGDGADCISDGRTRAAEYFSRLESLDPLYGRVADCFRTVAEKGQAMFGVVGGWERGEQQIAALGVKANREAICRLIREAKAADERALELLRELAGL